MRRRVRATDAHLVHQPRQRRRSRPWRSSARTPPAARTRVDIEILPNDADPAARAAGPPPRRQGLLDRRDELDVVSSPSSPTPASCVPTPPTETARLTDRRARRAGRRPACGRTRSYAAPFWANTQLLWYRKSVAAGRGRRPRRARLHLGRDDQSRRRPGQEDRRPGCPLRGLHGVDQRAGARPAAAQIINERRGRHATPPRALASPAGDKAAEIVGSLARSPAAPPDLSTAQEEEARAAFQGDNGMFMVNWPYVLAAARAAPSRRARSTSRVVDDIGWARYPQVVAGQAQRAAARRHQPRHRRLHHVIPTRPLALVECINALPKATQYMVDAGNPSPYAASYDDPAVREAYPEGRPDPRVDRRRRAAAAHARTTSTSPGRCIQTWHPPAVGQRARRRRETDTFMADVLGGKRLL